MYLGSFGHSACFMVQQEVASSTKKRQIKRRSVTTAEALDAVSECFWVTLSPTKGSTGGSNQSL